MRVRLAVPVTLDLLGKETQVLHIVLLFKLSLMYGNKVLLLFLPIKLFSFKLTGVFYLLAFFLESLVCQIIYFLNVMNVLLSLMLSVIVYFERTLRAHKVWIGLRVIIG